MSPPWARVALGAVIFPRQKAAAETEAHRDAAAVAALRRGKGGRGGRGRRGRGAVAAPTAAAALAKINPQMNRDGAFSHRTEETVMTKQPGLDGRHRDKDGKISKKHGNTLISTLRHTYGAGFAPGRSGDERLANVLHDLDEPSLSHLIYDLPRQST